MSARLFGNNFQLTECKRLFIGNKILTVRGFIGRDLSIRASSGITLPLWSFHVHRGKN